MPKLYCGTLVVGADFVHNALAKALKEHFDVRATPGIPPDVQKK